MEQSVIFYGIVVLYDENLVPLIRKYVEPDFVYDPDNESLWNYFFNGCPVIASDPNRPDKIEMFILPHTLTERYTNETVVVIGSIQTAGDASDLAYRQLKAKFEQMVEPIDVVGMEVMEGFSPAQCECC